MTDTATDDTTKPGWRTTEFWLSSAAKLLGILFASGVLGDGSLGMRIAGLAATVLAALGYTVSRGMVKAAAAVLLVGLAAPSSSACTPAQRAATPTALIDCTSANGQAIGETASSMRGECATSGVTDWGCVTARAITAGLRIGGCAFLEILNARPVALMASAEPDPGLAAFERYRSQHAGGATFRTAAGDR